MLLPDHWSITNSGSVTRLHLALHGMHLINVYSLSGNVIYASRNCANDALIKLPKGCFYRFRADNGAFGTIYRKDF